MNKKIYIILTILIIIIILLGGYIVYDKLLNEKQEDWGGMVDINDDEEKIVLEDLLGYWYLTSEMNEEMNATNIDIKSISNDKLVMNLYITKVATIKGIEVTMNNNHGTFYTTSDTLPTDDGKIASISGSIEISKDSIKLNITDTNISYLDKNEKYTFRYHTENGNLDNYNGIWYESEKHSKDSNPNSLTIKEINKNKVIFDLYITRTAAFENIEVYISDSFSDFEAITYNGVSSNEDTAKIEGSIKMTEDKIVLNVGLSNVKYLSSGTEYTFTYKK